MAFIHSLWARQHLICVSAETSERIITAGLGPGAVCPLCGVEGQEAAVRLPLRNAEIFRGGRRTAPLPKVPFAGQKTDRQHHAHRMLHSPVFAAADCELAGLLRWRLITNASDLFFASILTERWRALFVIILSQGCYQEATIKPLRLPKTQANL